MKLSDDVAATDEGNGDRRNEQAWHNTTQMTLENCMNPEGHRKLGYEISIQKARRNQEILWDAEKRRRNI